MNLRNGIESEKRKEQELFELAEKLRTPQTRKKPSAWAMNWAAWCLAADAKNPLLFLSAARDVRNLTPPSSLERDPLSVFRREHKK